MNGVRRVAYQRHSVRGKLARIAPGQREQLALTFKRAQSETVIKSHAQRLIELLRGGGFHLLRLFRHQRPDNGALMRIA
ncbi:hypothetical protein D3C76_1526330 [compost metagenome]